jgi:hypothetical protein
MLHPFVVGGSIPSFRDTFQINVSTAGRVIRSLARKGIVKHNRVSHPQDVATRRKRGNRPTDSRGKASRQYAVFIREFDIAAPLRLPGKKSFEDMLAAGKMLSGSLDVSPAIHRPTGNSFEHHDLAGTASGQSGKDKVLANIRNYVEAHRRVRLSRAHMSDIGQSEAALRFGERRTVSVALEQLSDGAIPTGDDHQIMAAGAALKIVDVGSLDLQFSAALLKFIHPAGYLEPLVH